MEEINAFNLPQWKAIAAFTDANPKVKPIKREKAEYCGHIFLDFDNKKIYATDGKAMIRISNVKIFNPEDKGQVGLPLGDFFLKRFRGTKPLPVRSDRLGDISFQPLTEFKLSLERMEETINASIKSASGAREGVPVLLQPKYWQALEDVKEAFDLFLFVYFPAGPQEALYAKLRKVPDLSTEMEIDIVVLPYYAHAVCNQKQA